MTSSRRPQPQSLGQPTRRGRPQIGALREAGRKPKSPTLSTFGRGTPASPLKRA